MLKLKFFEMFWEWCRFAWDFSGIYNTTIHTIIPHPGFNSNALVDIHVVGVLILIFKLLNNHDYITINFVNEANI